MHLRTWIVQYLTHSGTLEKAIEIAETEKEASDNARRSGPNVVVVGVRLQTKDE